MSNKKQTAVDWFFSELERMQYFIGNDMIQAYKQAKEMEGEQTMDVYKKGYIDGECNATDITIIQRNL
jgi:hypothetical protein